MTTPKKPPSPGALRQRRYEQRKRAAAAAEAIIANPPAPSKPLAVNHDVAEVLRTRYTAIINEMSDEDLLDKDFMPSLGVALKAQAAIDRREVAKTKQGNAELAFAIIGMLGGGTAVPLVEAVNPVEGEFSVVDDDKTD